MRKRDEAKKEAIVEASIDLINRIGFAEVSISKIAKQAKVSPATIYIYFDNKEDLINKLYLYVKRRVSSSISLNYNNGKSWEKNFYEGFHRMAASMIPANSDFAFMMQCANNPMLNDATREEGTRMFQDAIRFFDVAIEGKVIKPIKQELLFALVSAPLFSLINDYAQKGFILETDDIQQLAECTWDALKL